MTWYGKSNIAKQKAPLGRGSSSVPTAALDRDRFRLLRPWLRDGGGGLGLQLEVVFGLLHCLARFLGALHQVFPLVGLAHDCLLSGCAFDTTPVLEEFKMGRYRLALRRLYHQ